ncbi:MAG: HAMP domain-containing protein [Anaerolineae bacterium]|nr:HAMP domain-containing protein [Anaerolineae bacterium]
MALAISLGFLALFVAFLLLGEWALRDNTAHLLNERLVLTQMAASQIDGLLQEAIAELEQAHRFADFDSVDPDLSVEADALAHAYGQVGIFASGLIFLDRQGRVVLSHPARLFLLGDDLSSLPHVAQALTQRKATISEPFLEPLHQRPVIAVTVPIWDDHRFSGLLSGLVDLSGTAIETSLMQTIKLGQTAHAALVDRQGRILASTFNLPFLSPGEHVSFYRRAMAQGQPVVETVPFELDLPAEPRNHFHVMAFAPLKNVPWGVVVGGDLDETFAGVQRLQLGLALLGTVALAGVWTATMVGARQLVRPMQNLTRAAHRIAQGDLQTPLQTPAAGEISVMAVALENMRRQLLANIEALADWNESLETRVAEQTEELRQQQVLTQQLLHRAITAQEEERARLSQELHDGVGQMLTAVELSLDRLMKALPPGEASAHERLERARVLTEQSLTDLRRLIAALRPGILDQLGLVPALDWVSDHTLRPLGIMVTLEADDLRQRLPGEIETILFRIAQEAMSNVARHSQARHLVIRLWHEAGRINMALADDGQGCDLSTLAQTADYGRGLGLAGMQERASLAGGQVTIDSGPGQGTAVRVVVPVPDPLSLAEDIFGLEVQPPVQRAENEPGGVALA